MSTFALDSSRQQAFGQAMTQTQNRFAGHCERLARAIARVQALSGKPNATELLGAVSQKLHCAHGLLYGKQQEVASETAPAAAATGPASPDPLQVAMIEFEIWRTMIARMGSEVEALLDAAEAELDALERTEGQH